MGILFCRTWKQTNLFSSEIDKCQKKTQTTNIKMNNFLLLMIRMNKKGYQSHQKLIRIIIDWIKVSWRIYLIFFFVFNSRSLKNRLNQDRPATLDRFFSLVTATKYILLFLHSVLASVYWKCTENWISDSKNVEIQFNVLFSLLFLEVFDTNMCLV